MHSFSVDVARCGRGSVTRAGWRSSRVQHWHVLWFPPGCVNALNVPWLARMVWACSGVFWGRGRGQDRLMVVLRSSHLACGVLWWWLSAAVARLCTERAPDTKLCWFDRAWFCFSGGRYSVKYCDDDVTTCNLNLPSSWWVCFGCLIF